MGLVIFLCFTVLVWADEPARTLPDAGRARVSWPNGVRPLVVRSPRQRAAHQLARDLLERSEEKELEDTFSPYRSQLRQWHMPGVYKTEIKLNVVGGVAKTLVRELLSWRDPNPFTTGWVQKFLLEIARLAPENFVHDRTMATTMRAVQRFKDKNKPRDVPAIIFWPQRPNPTGPGYSAFPMNVMRSVGTGVKFADWLDRMGRRLGLDTPFDDLGESIYFMMKVPPDIDCSAMYLDIGGLLKQNRQRFPRGHSQWLKQPVSWSKLSKLFTDICYAPGEDSARSVIDPRSYYWMHPWLEQHAGDKPLVATTWLTTVASDRRRPYENQIWNVNNVDATEAANVLAGVGRVVAEDLTAPQPADVFFTNEMQRMYRSTASLLTWAVRQNVAYKRLDLVPLYYPNYMLYVYATARAAVIPLEKPERFRDYPGVLSSARTLMGALRGVATRQLLRLAVRRSSEVGAYWHSDLGTDDSILGFRVGRPDDAVGSTAVAVEAFITMWSRTSSASTGCRFRWIRGTPASVKQAVRDGVAFLLAHAAGRKYEKEFLWFTADFKGKEVFPMRFPGNYAEWVNGTRYTRSLREPVPRDALAETVAKLSYGVKGVIPAAEYQRMLEQEWFGEPVATKRLDLGKAKMVYWTSKAMTFTMSALALLRGSNVC